MNFIFSFAERQHVLSQQSSLSINHDCEGQWQFSLFNLDFWRPTCFFVLLLDIVLLFQEHNEYSLVHLDEIMLLLHGMKPALDNKVLESQLLCYQHLLVHMIKVDQQFFSPCYYVVSVWSFGQKAMLLLQQCLELCFQSAWVMKFHGCFVCQGIVVFLWTTMQSQSLFCLACLIWFSACYLR